MNTTTATASFALARASSASSAARPTSDGDGVKLTRVLTQPLQQRLDPFLMLDAFGSDAASDYIGGFPDHPHRGFETVTIMLEGRMRHRDSVGNVGLLEPGSVQWMTAGRGIIHSEMPEQEEGRMAGFQLWVNLAADGQDDGRRPTATSRPATCRADADAAGVDGARDRRREPRRGRRGDAADDRADRASTSTLPPGASFDAELPAGHNAFAYVYGAARSTIGGAGARRAVERERMAILANDAGSDGVRLAAADAAARRACCWSPAGRSASRSRSTGRS